MCSLMNEQIRHLKAICICLCLVLCLVVCLLLLPLYMTEFLLLLMSNYSIYLSFITDAPKSLDPSRLFTVRKGMYHKTTNYKHT